MPSPLGSVRSFSSYPKAGVPANFKFACGGCSDTGSNTKLYSVVKAQNPLLMLEYGDLHYWNIDTNDAALHRRAIDTVLLAPRRGDLYTSVPIDWVWDDHDFADDNSDGTSPSRPAAQSVYREYFPAYPLPEVPPPPAPATTKVVVTPTTRYEPRRGFVAFYNWLNLAAIPIDLSTILSPGDAYSVYDVRDLVHPVITGVYAGGTVDFPVSQVADPPPIGGFVGSSIPFATAPFFDAFLVKRDAFDATFTYDFYVSPTGGTGGGTIGDPWSLAYAASGAGGTIAPGHHIALRGGVYDTGTGTLDFTVSGLVGPGVDLPGQKVIFRAYQNEKPIIVNRANSAGLDDAVHLDCDYVWFWGIEWYDNGWTSRDVAPLFNNGLTIATGRGNGLKLIHNVIHDFESANIGCFNGPVTSDKCEIYGNVIYNAGVNRNEEGHNFYLHHQGSSSATINIDSNVVFNSFGLNCQIYSDTDFVDWFNVLNNIWFGAGALSSVTTGETQYQLTSVLLGGNSNSSHNCKILGNVFHAPPSATQLLKLGFNQSLSQGNLEVGNNYGFGGGVASGSFSSFVINAPVVPQVSLNVHDNTWFVADVNSVLSIVDAGALSYTWSNNVWYHTPGTGFNGASFTVWSSDTGLGTTDQNLQIVVVHAGAIYHSFVVGRCRFVVTDLRSNRDSKSNPDSSTHTQMDSAQLAWFKHELLTARDSGELVFWFSTVPWIAPAGDNNGDDWGGFTFERTVVGDYIENLGWKNIIIFTGDMHSAAIDDGTNEIYTTGGFGGGLTVFLPFPQNQTTQIYGGSYTQGPITHVGTRLMGFVGIVTVVDDGLNITVTLEVWNELGPVMSFTKTFSAISCFVGITWQTNPLLTQVGPVGSIFTPVVAQTTPIFTTVTGVDPCET